MLTTIPVRWLEDNRGWRVETNLTASGSGVGSWTFNVQRSTFNGVRLNLSVRPVAQPSRLRVPAPSRCEDDAGGETPPSLAGGDACATTDTTRFADTSCDHATVARSRLPRSAEFLPAPQNEEARQAGSPLPSGSTEIAGSGLKSALRPELSSQSAAQASSLYRKSAQLPDSLSSLRSFAAVVLRNQRVVWVHSLQFAKQRNSASARGTHFGFDQSVQF